jgi:uncharacterized membrane protein
LKQNLKYVLLAICVAVYAGVRLWHLTDSCLWFDEIFSIHAATTGFDRFFGFVADDLIHPPLFYLLLKFWIAAGGESLLWIRLFPVFFSILGVIPFLLLCRELDLSFVQTLAALLFFATNGSLIKYSQEVRMYSLLLFLSLLSIWLFARWLKTANTVPRLLWLVNVLLIYSHYFGLFVVAAELLVVIWKRRGIRKFLPGVFVCLLSFVPWLAAVARSSGKFDYALGQNIGWQERPAVLAIWQFVVSLHQGFYFPRSSVDSFFTTPTLLAILISAGSLVALTVKNWRDARLRLLAIIFIVPPAIAFTTSWILPVSVWGIRHLTIIFPIYFLLLATAIFPTRTGVPPPKDYRKGAVGLNQNGFHTAVFLILLAAVALSGVQMLARESEPYIWCGWEELAEHAEKAEPSPATVYAFEDLAAYHIWFVSRDKLNVVKINGYEDMPEDKAYFLPRGFDDVRTGPKTDINGDTFWLAFRSDRPDQGLRTDGMPKKQVLEDLEKRGYVFGPPFEFKAQGSTAYMVPVAREQQ